MDLIFLYGLPGSGKLTIAKSLVERSGERFKLFHNQMTIDIISSIIPYPHPKGFELNTRYRQLMVSACNDLNINLVMTFVYAQNERGDDLFVKSIMRTVENKMGRILFVHLVCDEAIIFQRIQNEDRKLYRKVTDPKNLKQSMEKWELTKPISYVKNLTIDTGLMEAETAADKILSHFN